MCIRYLGFLLLIWLPGITHGQSVAQSCSAPNLEGGFFSPKLEIYPHGAQLTYTCNDGHVPVVRGWWAASSCQNGKWTHEPQCIESLHACSAPPKIPHAVIIDQGYQDVFAADSELQYECEDGYAVEGVNTNKSIICLSGIWSKGPVCKLSSSSGGDAREEGRQITTIDNCGKIPTVSNGDVVETGQRFLKYQCISYYIRVGPQYVQCYSDGSWSEIPTCQAAYCKVNTAEYSDLVNDGVKFIGYGEVKRLLCKHLKWYWINDYYSEFRCTDGRISFGRCCSWVDDAVGKDC